MPKKIVNASPLIRVFKSDGHICTLQEVEREVIARAITRYNGNLSECAVRLGIGRSTLYRKLQEYRLTHL